MNGIINRSKNHQLELKTKKKKNCVPCGKMHCFYFHVEFQFEQKLSFTVGFIIKHKIPFDFNAFKRTNLFFYSHFFFVQMRKSYSNERGERVVKYSVIFNQIIIIYCMFDALKCRLNVNIYSKKVLLNIVLVQYCQKKVRLILKCVCLFFFFVQKT